ncbi:hypothetical protein [Bacillus suaedae]|uniref:Phage abortive infection protein n=1 Tax=Halalkalibacter suaedae TaxID=2822140 RepID=A0A941AMB2_9BACI|nr:hypothetical protein [Bacillus suaedae]MBP3950320.1 hypothetical protein [Bacillus suaedae]
MPPGKLKRVRFGEGENFLKLSYVVVITVSSFLFSLLLFPVIFNYLFLWDSGNARGDISDWFTLFGGIISGLISGLFTYLALWITIQTQRKKEIEKQAEEDKRKIVNFILYSKYYLDRLDETFYIIRNQFGLDFVKMLNEVSKNINFRESSFKEHGYSELPSHIDINKFESSLTQVIQITEQYREILRKSLNELKKDRDMYKMSYNTFLAIENLYSFCYLAQNNNYYDDYDFILNFISDKEKFGFTGLIKVLKEDFDELWKSYVADDENMLGDYIIEIEFPHIKG